MTTEELYQRKCITDQWKDLIPRMADLRRYAERVQTIVEFGTRTGNSTTAFLAGGATVYGFDLDQPKFECPADSKSRWTFKIADTATLETIPHCDLIFFDTVHNAAQLKGELRMAKYSRKYLMFHDIIEWGCRGERGQGIDYAILDFLRDHEEWRVENILFDKWGILVLERIK